MPSLVPTQRACGGRRGWWLTAQALGVCPSPATWRREDASAQLPIATPPGHSYHSAQLSALSHLLLLSNPTSDARLASPALAVPPCLSSSSRFLGLTIPHLPPPCHPHTWALGLYFHLLEQQSWPPRRLRLPSQHPAHISINKYLHLHRTRRG